MVAANAAQRCSSGDSYHRLLWALLGAHLEGDRCAEAQRPCSVRNERLRAVPRHSPSRHFGLGIGAGGENAKIRARTVQAEAELPARFRVATDSIDRTERYRKSTSRGTQTQTQSLQAGPCQKAPGSEMKPVLRLHLPS